MLHVVALSGTINDRKTVLKRPLGVLDDLLEDLPVVLAACEMRNQRRRQVRCLDHDVREGIALGSPVDGSPGKSNVASSGKHGTRVPREARIRNRTAREELRGHTLGEPESRELDRRAL